MEKRVGHDWVSPYPLAPQGERSAFRSQIDILNSMCDEYNDLYHDLYYKQSWTIPPFMMEKFNLSRSLLENHVNLLGSMLETRPKKCVLGCDLFKECWDLIDRGEDLLSERFPIFWRVSEGPDIDNAVIKVSNPLPFRNDLQIDDSMDDEDPVERTAADVPTASIPPGAPDPATSGSLHLPGPALSGPESANATCLPNAALPGPVLASTTPRPSSASLGSASVYAPHTPITTSGGPESTAASAGGLRVTCCDASTLANTTSPEAPVPTFLTISRPEF